MVLGFEVCVCWLNKICVLGQTCVHLRALTSKHHEHSEMEEQRGMVKRVAVQRISSTGAALLSVTFFLPSSRWVINRIPCAVLIGLLVQVI